MECNRSVKTENNEGTEQGKSTHPSFLKLPAMEQVTKKQDLAHVFMAELCTEHTAISWVIAFPVIPKGHIVRENNRLQRNLLKFCSCTQSYTWKLLLFKTLIFWHLEKVVISSNCIFSKQWRGGNSSYSFVEGMQPDRRGGYHHYPGSPSRHFKTRTVPLPDISWSP